MSAVEPDPRRGTPPLRALALLVRPAKGWAAIEADETTLRELYLRQIAPFAAVPSVCGVIGGLLFGSGIAGIDIRPPVQGLLAEAAASFVFTLIGIWLMAQIVALIAPRFGGAGERMAALKLVAYSATPAWLLGVFGLIPSIGGAVMLLGALYGLYLLGEGLPRLMKVPRDKALTCFAVILIAGLVLAVVMGMASGAVRSLAGGPPQVMGQGRG